MGPNPYLRFLHAKQHLLEQNYKCLLVPDMTCRFLCLKNSVISPWNTSLYGSKPSSEVFTCKKGLLDPNNNSLWVPDLTCPFVQAKHRHLRQNIKSIWVPALSCGFCMQNSDFRTRLTSLYGSQTSSVVLSTHNSVLSKRINRPYWFQLSPVVLCIQNSDFRTRITSVCGSKTPPVVFACKTATSGPE